MTSKLAHAGVLCIAVVGLVATMVPTASADTYKTVLFTGGGGFSGCQGLQSPPPGLIPGVTTASDPKGFPGPIVTPGPGATTCAFFVNSVVCTKTSVGKKVIPLIPLCEFTLSGTARGFCGLWTASGTATISNFEKGRVFVPFTATAVDDSIFVTGGSMDTNIRGQMTTQPNTGSCAVGTSTGFTVLLGEILYKDCTDGTVAGVCDVP